VLQCVAVGGLRRIQVDRGKCDRRGCGKFRAPQHHSDQFAKYTYMKKAKLSGCQLLDIESGVGESKFTRTQPHTIILTSWQNIYICNWLSLSGCQLRDTESGVVKS